MPLILHLSDLHLVASERSPVLGDHKAKLVPPVDRLTQHEMLRRTFAGLATRLVSEGRKIDAIVMSGDVSHQNDSAGFGAFLELLDALGTSRPDPSHIVIVPGNHDVERGLLPGDPARYEPFASSMRAAGFVTPLLDGIDTGPVAVADVFRHILRVGDVEIVPINTAAYAQVRIDIGVSDPTWEAVVSAADAIGGSEVRKALEKLRVVDAARVSEHHLEAVRRLLGDASAATLPHRRRDQTRPPLLRIAVLHHQLLPVSTEEEIKAFESFTNLGLLRQFLRANDIAVVLHGHKHTPHSYVDYVWSYEDATAGVPRQVRVIAGPSPSGRALDDQDVCRLLDIDVAAGTIAMETVPAVVAGQASKTGRVQLLTFSQPGAATVVRTDGVSIVDGSTITDVYTRLIPTVRHAVGEGELENVVCHLQESPSDDALAVLYPGFRAQPPDDPTVDDGESEISPEAQLAHFRELVRWWQDPQLVGVGDEPAFTHGSRILRYDGYLDQLVSVVDAIIANTSTSRAVMVLLQPSADRIGTPSQPFPSFCFVQFLVRRGPGAASPRLDCVAYFRKQEVRYWWLVNVAELASLQRRIVAELQRRAKGKLSWLTRIALGSVTTIAARAHVGRTPPKVQVPKIDQYYAISRERLVDMAHAIVWEQMPDRRAIGTEWLELMWDLVPTLPRDPDGVAVALPGLRYLLEQVRHHLPRGGSSGSEDVKELVTVLEALWQENDRYSAEQQLDRVTEERHAQWRNAVIGHVQRIVELTVAPLRSDQVATEQPRQGNEAAVKMASTPAPASEPSEAGRVPGKHRGRESAEAPPKAVRKKTSASSGRPSKVSKKGKKPGRRRTGR